MVKEDTAVKGDTVTTWMNGAAAAIRAQRDFLTQLDAAIGDGDHGANMDRGFAAVQATLAEHDRGDDAPGHLLSLAGRTLISTVGGASGPLWGTALKEAGRALGDRAVLDGSGLAAALDAATDGVIALGAAVPGDKTMVDALLPAVRALRTGVQNGEPLVAAVRAAAEAAELGARATVPLRARKGRASYLGERSIGHQDPGATSVALVMRALEQAVERSQ